MEIKSHYDRLYSDVRNVGIPLYAEDLHVRKEIKGLIDVIQNITKHMLETPRDFAVSVMMTAELTVL
jgi:hypothetical protein